MNQKLSFQDLASRLSAAASQPSAFSEEFIKELFAVVSDALAAGESVKIKGLGEFKPMPDAPDKLSFIPDEALAEKVNAPFSQFAPAALNPSVTDELLDSVEAVEEEEERIDDNEAVSVSEPVIVTETEILSPEAEEIPAYIPVDTAETEAPQPAVEDSIE
ncbi:MAG: HU family DNA-binding protein, partial [Duncaniella sp.]|nr:HU family DNA-binding protein [Duncaniella sp.]